MFAGNSIMILPSSLILRILGYLCMPRQIAAAYRVFHSVVIIYYVEEDIVYSRSKHARFCIILRHIKPEPMAVPETSIKRKAFFYFW